MRFTRIALHRAALVGVSVVAVALPANASAPDLATQKKIAAMSVPFVANAGQWNARAAFAAQTFAGTLFVTKQGELVYSLPGKPFGAGTESVGAESAALGSREATPSRRLPKPSERSPGWALTETLVDSKGHVRPMHESTLKAPAGYRPMEGKVSYAIGNDAAKHTNNLNTYERVNLGDMYPGINVQLRATGSNVEKIFTVAPQQDPMQINIAVAGADKLEIGGSGELIAHTGNGPVTFTAPIAFQENAAGERVAVSVSYALNGDGQRYGFVLGEYDRAQALVIDPLLQSTYLGGAATDVATAIAIHPASGDVYIGGYTDSADLPGVIGGGQSNKAATRDAFIGRFTADLATRLQTTFFGGYGTRGGTSVFDTVTSLVVHPVTSEIYVAGNTDSPDLPSINGGAQSVKAPGFDGFVARFNPALTAVLQSSYIGGSNHSFAIALTVHPISGDIYVAGQTIASDLPGRVGGAQSTKLGYGDGFVMRFGASLTTMSQSTYVGTAGDDFITSIAIHPFNGNVYVAARSAPTDLPGIGDGNVSITALTSSLTARINAITLGGSGYDAPYRFAIHPQNGDVYVVGYSTSTNLTGAIGAAQSVKSVGRDGFISKIDSSLSTVLQSSYLGGAGEDTATSLAIHPATGDIYVAGYTTSIDFPGAVNGAQPTPANGFVTRFNPALTSRIQSTYLGGSAYGDYVNAVVVHPVSGEIYVTGPAISVDFPAALGGAQAAASTAGDAFITRISANLAAAPATCNLDIDQDGQVTAATDGLMVLRRMLGLSGVALAAGAANPVGAQTDPEAMTNSINTMLASQLLDLDGSGGAPNASTDGLILVRAMLGFTGTAVTNGPIVGAPPRNTWPLIRDYLNQNCGTNFNP